MLDGFMVGCLMDLWTAGIPFLSRKGLETVEVDFKRLRQRSEKFRTAVVLVLNYYARRECSREKEIEIYDTVVTSKKRTLNQVVSDKNAWRNFYQSRLIVPFCEP